MSAKNTSYPKEKVNVLFLENISDSALKYFKTLVIPLSARSEAHYRRMNS